MLKLDGARALSRLGRRVSSPSATTRRASSRFSGRAVQRYSRHRDVRVLNTYDDNRQDLGGRVARLVAGSTTPVPQS